MEEKKMTVLTAEEAKKALRSVPKSDNREPRVYTAPRQEPRTYHRNADGLMTQIGAQPTVKQQISKPQAIRDFTTGDIVQTVPKQDRSVERERRHARSEGAGGQGGQHGDEYPVPAERNEAGD